MIEILTEDTLSIIGGHLPSCKLCNFVETCKDMKNTTQNPINIKVKEIKKDIVDELLLKKIIEFKKNIQNEYMDNIQRVNEKTRYINLGIYTCVKSTYYDKELHKLLTIEDYIYSEFLPSNLRSYKGSDLLIEKLLHLFSRKLKNKSIEEGCDILNELIYDIQ
tara:strand:- start:1105 stop:1593 length:489 start_codon:yes stop_codon:yes gene_type:complete